MGRAVLLIAMLLTAGCAFVNSHLREVAKGRLYRSAQMNAESLRGNVRALGIKTVINVRGAGRGARWWEEEVQVCRELGVAHHDLHWRDDRLPAPESLAEFVRLLATSEEPILVHCKAGQQRAAFGSAVFLLREGASPDAARRQFGLFFFDARIGDVVDMYERSGLGLPFDQWVLEVYPGLYRDR